MSIEAIKSGDSFKGAKSNTNVLRHLETSQIKYDLIGKITEGTVLTRKTVAAIFTPKSPAGFDKAFKAEKHIQDYVFKDGLAEKSVERQFAEELDCADEVCVYAKLPKLAKYHANNREKDIISRKIPD